MIIKRDLRKAKFDAQKIENAITKAFYEVDGQITDYALAKARNIASYIEKFVEEANKDFTVEEIQDLVEHGLMSCKRKDVARAYITYRNERTAIREKRDSLRAKAKEALFAKNVQNNNANLDENSFGGRMGTAASIITSQLAQDELFSPTTRYNFLNNRVYIHDRDHYILGDHNCLTMPLDDLLAKGFNTRQLDCRPAGSISSAMQLIAVLFQLQSLCQFGGVSASHLDWTLVPYVRKSFYKHYKDGMEYFCEDENWNISKELIEDFTDSIACCNYKTIEDIPITEFFFYPNKNDDSYEFNKVYNYAMKMTIKECHQAAESMLHNLNTLQSRSGNQLPFTSINYGTCALPEGRIITRAILEETIKGGGRLHKTYIFPCQIFQVMKGVNDKEGTPNYDLFKLALKCTARRIYPNYANVDWSGNAGYDRNDPKTYFSTMGCRTSNGLDINAEPGVNPQTKDGRGNICPVTIILPTLAMEAQEAVLNNENSNGTEEEIINTFMSILDRTINEAKDSLIDRFNWICSQDASAAAFMYENNTMLGYHPEEGIKSALIHGTLVVGQLGLAECLQILVGCNHTKPKGMELAKKIEQLFKDKCAEFKKVYHLNFGVYMTPAESLCYTAMTKFKSIYGEIPNVSDRKYFTNSMHIPVWEKISAFDKIDLESQLTGYSSAGCITYIELDSGVKNNIEALEQLVLYAMNKDIPYFALNICLDTCLECGYTDELNDVCPCCGSSHIQRLRRVTGYLTGNYTTAFNLGKQAETEERVKHTGLEYEIC